MTIGFRFRPNDREIINDYLLKRMDGQDFSYVIPDIDLCRYEPWELPGISVLEDEEVWYFFCRPEYKYRNSKRANRATGTGFWKPTGKVRPIRGHGGGEIGTKRTLVFYSKTGTGSVSGRTTWVIHEYQVQNVLPGQKEFVFCKLKDKVGEQTDSSTVQDTEPGVQAGIDAGFHASSATTPLGEMAQQIQQALDASESEFDLNDLHSAMERKALAPAGISYEDWSKVNCLLFEDSEDDEDPAYADKFLIEPEDSAEHFHLPPNDYQQQRPQNQSYLVDDSDTVSDVCHREYLEQVGSSRMNGGNGSAIQFRQTTSVQTINETLPPLSHDVNQSRIEVVDTSSPDSCCLVKVLQEPEELKFRGSAHQEVSLMHRKRQAVAPTTKSAGQAKNYYILQAGSDSSSSHRTAPRSIYLVNLIVGLILLIVFIMWIAAFPKSQNDSEFFDFVEDLPDFSDWFFG